MFCRLPYEKKENPFDSQEFLDSYESLIQNLQPVDIRTSFKGVLSAYKFSMLPTILASEGVWRHNEEFLQYLRVGGRESYLKLIEVLEKSDGELPGIAKALRGAL